MLVLGLVLLSGGLAVFIPPFLTNKPFDTTMKVGLGTAVVGDLLVMLSFIV